MANDARTQEWEEAHVEDVDFYVLDHADKAFFHRHMRNPTISALATLARTITTPLRLLEIGCGSGADSVCLALQGYDVTVMDISEHLLHAASRLAARAAALFPDQPLRISFARGDIFDLLGHNDQYDVVLCFGVIVIWRERAKRMEALRNLRAVVKDQGVLLLGTANTLHPLFKILPVTDIVSHLADHNILIMEQEVREAGFVITKRGAVGLSANFEQWLTVPWLRLPLRLGNALFERMPVSWQIPLAPRVFVLAQKTD